eukprot:293673-Amphidinium_carterae.1
MSTTFYGSVNVPARFGRLGISLCQSTSQSLIVSSLLGTSRHPRFKHSVPTALLLCNAGSRQSRARTPLTCP